VSQLYLQALGVHRTIILPIVLYGFEIWSLTLRKEHRLKVSENRMMRIIGPGSVEVAGD
jgi:hypothetical protein